MKDLWHWLDVHLTERGWKTETVVISSVFALAAITALTLVIALPEVKPVGERTRSFHLLDVVQSNTNVPDDGILRVYFSERMADGSIKTVSTQHGALYGQVTKKACIRVTKEVGTDRSWISLANMTKCKKPETND